MHNRPGASNAGGDHERPKVRQRRPRNAPSIGSESAFDGLTDQTFTVVIDGVGRKLDTERALQQRTLQDAFAGKLTAIGQVVIWIRKREAKLPASGRMPITIKFANQKSRHVDDAIQLLGIATQTGREKRDDGRPVLMLEPSRVDLALRRPSGRSLSAFHLRDLIEKTRNPQEVQWPDGAHRG